MANAESLRKVADILQKASEQNKIAVVVSASAGVTDALLQCGRSASLGDAGYKNEVQALLQHHINLVQNLLPVLTQSSLLSYVMQQFNEVEDICNSVAVLQDFSPKSKDKLLSYGEVISSQILSRFLAGNNIANTWKDARQLIVTDALFTQANVQFEKTNQNIQAYFDSSNDSITILPGFIAATIDGQTTTLGRGGSDYTAAILGAALQTASVEIWTDVSGMMTADPRLVQNAKCLKTLSYHEAMELSHFGAKVIYPPTLAPLMHRNIPVWIKNTFAPDAMGTLINSNNKGDANLIKGISNMQSIALLSLEGSGMVGIPGFSKRLFEALANASINVILITQASSEHSICVGILERNAPAAKEAVDAAFEIEMKTGQLEALTIEKDLSVIALVGDQMKSHVGVSGRMFSALGRNGVNIRAIAQGSSERNISAVVAAVDVKKAVNVLHETFFETTRKQLNLFIIGTGNVGSKLIMQLQQQAPYLLQQQNMQIRIIALANSRQMLFKDDGIDMQQWEEGMQEAVSMHQEEFVQNIIEKNLRNSIFVDVTASDAIAGLYEKLLQKSIAVVACNKIACTQSYQQYKTLKEKALEFNAPFLFETNVGAGLPVIGTLNDLLRSGDRILKIEAVLSGTLNFVFNHYNGDKTFSSVVQQAQAEGYTEPDPRLDLSGTDVMRKIMILARETGIPMEMEAISNQPFMPPECMQGSVEDFYNTMEVHEPHFKQLYQKASAKGAKLKYVASFSEGTASVGLQEIPPEHDFFHLYGKDNIILFYTSRYPEQPLVVKGAGAGAEVTAAGVFADIIRAAGL